MPERYLAKRISLSGLLDGWDDDCFALVKPATVADQQDFRARVKQAKDEPDNADDEWQQQFVAKHFISGTGYFYSELGTQVRDDLTPEHLEIAVLSDQLLLGIVGIDLDPKALPAAAAAQSLANGGASTETPLSEDSAPTSPTT